MTATPQSRTHAPVDDPEARADLVQALIPDAAFLAMAVRDRDPDDIRTRLAGLSRHELEALAVVLAAMVDPDRTLRDALAWVDFDEYGDPLPTGWRSSSTRTLTQVAREDPPSRTLPGPEYAKAIRALEGEAMGLSSLENTLAVRIGLAQRGMTYDEVAAELGMSPDAVRRAWERIKARAREAGLPVPRRVPREGDASAA